MADRENNKYYIARKKLGYTREVASELVHISQDRLFRIEDGNIPTPEEVCAMAEAYNKPELKNYHCNCECMIGQTNGIDVVGDVEKEKLPLIILELLSSLNSIKKDRLIDISADGEIDGDEVADFIAIKHQLDAISQTVEALRIWADKHIK